VTADDFNGDGVPDLVVTHYHANSITLLLGNGDGTFQPQVEFSVGRNPIELAVSDFNGDSKPDAAVANSFSNNVSVLINSTPKPGASRWPQTRRLPVKAH
jgi:hypothetical protein